ncbi:MAG: ferredoxin [Cytophagales bacterium CG12_big_fil_rev_8_21_14_0_65_40_12]|nr:MAG: ferredoxin [Cytophagales bacterium CG12_big_fil_rev_8_21_14_0_65_40_12]PIW04055.1 MAG: ferredoxin [Cytophagales bacterium CG17_big_fil_post_rev_8_21_14_2_50_40_13]
MAKIIIENLNNKEVSSTDNSKSVLDIIHENGIDWMHACGKNGRCTTCKLIVVEGAENLSPIGEVEQKLFEVGKLMDGERVACQAKVHGDIKVRVAEKNKFPHMEYTA